jgi:hypothetical protein
MEMLKSDGRPLCANKIPRARMESECGYGTGIVLDFKHEDCLHDNLKMDLIQNVDCMATDMHAYYHMTLSLCVSNMAESRRNQV